MTARHWELDALRGLMLVLMTLTHLPTRFASPAGQPFGFVSAAEGFVLLSAYVAGLVYTRRERRDGAQRMQQAFWRRALKLYGLQAGLLVFLFTVVLGVGALLGQPAVLNLASFFLERPLVALAGALALVYNPPLLDILPLYVLFMVASPVLLLHGLHRGWRGILAGSVALWLGAQFGLGAWLYGTLAGLLHWPVPVDQTGSFHLLAWQFPWVLGLWLGASHAEQPDAPPLRFPRWMVHGALAVTMVGMAWRHAVGQVPFPGMPEFNLLFDKWQLGPLRVISLFALIVLVWHHGPALARRMPTPKLLVTYGQASLPVFVAHVALVLALLATVGEPDADRPWLIDVLLLVGAFAILDGVALLSVTLDEAQARRVARRAGRAATA